MSVENEKRHHPRLEGKVIVVTGAGSGIGKATTELFLKHGATVIAADLHGAQHVADAGREGDVLRLVEMAKHQHGALHGFFANAGISGGLASIFEQSVEDWQEILRVNLIGPFLAIKHAAPVIREQGGGAG
jgi:NAD(P)-dependent dehydrogenase (short-subunit alcohol dehydrogenase family)